MRLSGVEAARGLAALLVVLVHASSMLSSPKYFGRKPFGGIFAFGHAGVDFFFVLSGFIIYYVHHNDVGCSDKFGSYAWKRFVRIFPNYWMATLLLCGILVVSPSRDGWERDSWGQLSSALCALGARADPSVGWTLRHELVFYALFGTLLRSSITFDNDTAFARHGLLASACAMTTWFCDAYASWRKGAVENANGRLRRDLPRDLDLDALGDAELQEIVLTHNLTPRKCLGFLTPLQALLKELGKDVQIRFA